MIPNDEKLTQYGLFFVMAFRDIIIGILLIFAIIFVLYTHQYNTVLLEKIQKVEEDNKIQTATIEALGLLIMTDPKSSYYSFKSKEKKIEI